MIVEGSLEVKLPTIWRDEKAVSREKSQKRKDQKKEDARARKGKVAKHCVFSWFCGSGGLKSRLAKAAGAEPAGHRRDEKLHAVVARSTFRSQNVQNTSGSDHFWKLRCTPLWREAHFEVKMLKTPGVRTTFGGSDVASLHYTTLHYTTLHSTTLHYVTLHYLPLHFTTLHYTTLHYDYTTTLHYTKLHYTTLHYTTLHYTTTTQLHSTTLNYTTLHYITLHYITLNDTAPQIDR